MEGRSSTKIELLLLGSQPKDELGEGECNKCRLGGHVYFGLKGFQRSNYFLHGKIGNATLNTLWIRVGQVTVNRVQSMYKEEMYVGGRT